jgi:hypothetical protein
VKELANKIENEYKLLTTAQKLRKLRKHNTDAYILQVLEYCSIGVRSSISSLINREYCGSDVVIERPELVDKDIIEEMTND